MTLGTNIRRIRKARGLTINEMAARIDSDVGNLSRLERDQQGYSDTLLKKIAGAIEVTVADLFVEEGSVQPAADFTPSKKQLRAYDRVVGLSKLTVLYDDLPEDFQKLLLEYAEDLRMQNESRQEDERAASQSPRLRKSNQK